MVDQFKTQLAQWITEVGTSKLLTIFEPETRSIPGVRIGESRFISGKLKSLTADSFYEFPRVYGRNSTLVGLWMFLAQEHPHEYLITAFGKSKGQTAGRPAQYYGIHVSYGSSAAVGFSQLCLDYLEKHVRAVSNSEIMVIHNHPGNGPAHFLSQLFEMGPLPSNKDRDTMMRFKFYSAVTELAVGGFKNIRFYVVEDGRLREFSIPPVNRIIRAIKTTLSA